LKDLTEGSIPAHIVEMAVPMGIGMLVQTLYYLVDLYFVGDLGDVALALNTQRFSDCADLGVVRSDGITSSAIQSCIDA
jgi:hypothetical protein